MKEGVNKRRVDEGKVALFEGSFVRRETWTGVGRVRCSRESIRLVFENQRERELH